MEGRELPLAVCGRLETQDNLVCGPGWTLQSGVILGNLSVDMEVSLLHRPVNSLEDKATMSAHSINPQCIEQESQEVNGGFWTA